MRHRYFRRRSPLAPLKTRSSDSANRRLRTAVQRPRVLPRLDLRNSSALCHGLSDFWRVAPTTPQRAWLRIAQRFIAGNKTCPLSSSCSRPSPASRRRRGTNASAPPLKRWGILARPYGTIELRSANASCIRLNSYRSSGAMGKRQLARVFRRQNTGKSRRAGIHATPGATRKTTCASGPEGLSNVPRAC